MMVMMLRSIDRRDQNLMRRLNGWRPPRWVRMLVILATRAGDGWLWWMLGLIILVAGGDDRYHALEAASLSAACAVLLFLRIKKLTGRKRPCAVATHAWAILLPPDQFSFPSGHSMTAFAVAIPLGLYYPAMLPGVLFCAASIAASRVLLGMHYLSDVVAGSMLGGVLGYGAYHLIR
jgi:undecaprenyl-diphosphatase